MPSDDAPSTSISLLNHVRDGQENAWARFVQLYGPLVVHWCRQYGLQASDMEDIVQDVFLTVSQSLEQFGKTSRSHNFRGWLWTIARSKIMDHFRKNKARPQAVSGTQLANVSTLNSMWDEQRSDMDSNQDLQFLISQTLGLIRQDFSERTWNAFWRSTAIGESPSNIGMDLQMSAAAVCMCRARVLRRVRETLAAENLQ